MVKNRVAYYYKEDEGHFYYGPGHPMKPHRLKLTHHLLLSYDLYRHLDVYRPHIASPAEMTTFHSPDYVDFLSRVSPETAHTFSGQMQKFAVGEYTDCPVFDDMFEFCQIYSGASLDGAARLNAGDAEICINWAGGLHHAKKSEASGFCYINDIVLAILELLKYHQRVLYIDIDVHHGDGVEEAFYVTDRVMTVSFHKFGGGFFPGTGDVSDIGAKKGKYYSLNFPLNEGIDDISYEHVFKPIIESVMTMYRPGAVVLQCGADSLTGDRIGCFNLTLHGHAKCVDYVKSFGLPMLVLGGGGYTIRNVARCWTFETATLLGKTLDDEIPHHRYSEYFAPDYRLHLTASDSPNMNPRDKLEATKATILQNLKYLNAAPSVAFQETPAAWAIKEVDEDAKDADAHHDDGRRQHEAEYYAGKYDNDGDDGGAAEDAEARGGRKRNRPTMEGRPAVGGGKKDKAPRTGTSDDEGAPGDAAGGSDEDADMVSNGAKKQ